MPGFFSPRKARLLAAGLSLAAVAAAVVVMVVVFWQVQSLPSGQPKLVASPNPLEALHAACIRDMLASTCKVMGTSTAADALAAPAAKPGELVFIAGVGAIAAVDYQQMYAAGDAMCSVVRDACAKDWSSSRCATARKLLLPANS